MYTIDIQQSEVKKTKKANWVHCSVYEITKTNILNKSVFY